MRHLNQTEIKNVAGGAYLGKNDDIMTGDYFPGKVTTGDYNPGQIMTGDYIPGQIMTAGAYLDTSIMSVGSNAPVIAG